MRDTSNLFGIRVAARRKERCLSQRQVAAVVGIDPSYLSRIERGRVQPTIGTAVRIATALRASLNDLAGPSPAETRDRPCPISNDGQCLMDLVDLTLEETFEPGDRHYSPREIRLIRRFVRFMRTCSPSSMKAVEVLLAGIRHRGPNSKHRSP